MINYGAGFFFPFCTRLTSYYSIKLLQLRIYCIALDECLCFFRAVFCQREIKQTAVCFAKKQNLRVCLEYLFYFLLSLGFFLYFKFTRGAFLNIYPHVKEKMLTEQHVPLTHISDYSLPFALHGNTVSASRFFLTFQVNALHQMYP